MRVPYAPAQVPVLTPAVRPAKLFHEAGEAVEHIIALYTEATEFLRDNFANVMKGGEVEGRYRAFYPRLELTTTSFARIDSRLSFGHVAEPGTYSATLTRPDLFKGYLEQQIKLLMNNHGVPVQVSVSDTPIPLHFALPEGAHVEGSIEDRLGGPLRDTFDVPDLETTNDDIVNGTQGPDASGHNPLAAFTAQRVDYSLARLAHYTATSPAHFQNHVLFTNYQFYMDEFVTWAKEQLTEDTGYVAFVEPGGRVTTRDGVEGEPAAKMPQMPTYHLTRADGNGITMVNIGVGPSNAKTITDHIAVLRPHAWLMLGHCAGLRHSQSLGDYVLAHAYVREDHVLDDDLPVWVPIPALAEIQVALENAVESVTGLGGYELKRIMRTGTVVTIDNRNWELRDQSGPVQRLSQSRAIALDMESATIAANGFRFRVPYGTLLCVSDKPLHGELKLPGMATDFYKRQVAQHLRIGLSAMEALREMPLERLHSRKLRSFDETAFL
ncbi:AMP nucleosidase [Pontivivens insulae]|uniref:AMP nucleosidase n=1 Tax=Pontivivens insulae TaxID=1639689 RepID=A0A2R8A6N4_9RHOB|nr:AMP nucleosidase [Pontivivens insulae]RED17933.1 AMP nucleosidase [Pontivivens insulae]SPF27822.1 AMP nucleosidase [Pontivivens insulae]